MPGALPNAVADLLAARYSGGRHQRARRRLPQRRKQPLLADLHREVVVLGLEAERARHAAAAGVELADLGARDALEQRHGGRGAGQRLLVAVAVEEDRAARDAGVRPQRERAVVDRLDQQLLYEPRL